MAVFRSLVLVVIGLAVINSFSSGHIAYPEDVNEVKAPVSGDERFHHGYTPGPPRDWGFHQRGPGHYRPGPHFLGSAPPRDRPSFSRPGGDARRSRSFQNSQTQTSPGPVSSLGSELQKSMPFENPSQEPNQESSDGDGNLRNPQGFRPPQRPQQGFRPQDGDVRPPRNGNIPGSGVPGILNQGNNYGLNFDQNGNPSPNNQGNPQIPGGNFQTTGGNFQNPGGNLNTGGNFQNPGGNQNSGGNFQNPGGNQNSGDNFQNPGGQTQATATTAGETTTRIPPRDPTNRIVYTVSCDCQYTRQYAPVCGTDGQTYGNLGVLQCAQRCGSNVQVFTMVACAGNRGGG